MQEAENASCEKYDLRIGMGRGWFTVVMGSAKNHTGLQGWTAVQPPCSKKTTKTRRSKKTPG